MLLSDKYPFLTNFFTTAISSKTGKLAQSIVFYGNDIDLQYTLSTEIARLLNCIGDKSDECQCLNCKWIRDGKHPAVLTVSRMDNKPEDDGAKTVISVKQAELIRNSLITTSEYHKVFILCDRDDDGSLKGLNRQSFQDSVANSLLKSIEEPPENVYFIFLTRDKEDLISTIISRSQCFFVPTKLRDDFSCDEIKPMFENYWDIERAQAFDVSENLLKLSEKHDSVKLLEQLQNYILSVLKTNPKYRFLIDDIKSVEQAKKSLICGIRPDIVFDEMCLKLIK